MAHLSKKFQFVPALNGRFPIFFAPVSDFFYVSEKDK